MLWCKLAHLKTRVINFFFADEDLNAVTFQVMFCLTSSTMSAVFTEGSPVSKALSFPD